MNKIKITVNNNEIETSPDLSILQAVQQADLPYAEIDIPSLYYLKDIQEMDASGIGVVEIEGEEGLSDAWSRKAEDGMVIHTETEATAEARKEILRDILKVHDHDCKNCVRTGNCELQYLLFLYDVEDVGERGYHEFPVDESSIIVRDSNKCIRCRRCVVTCEQVQGIGAIQAEGEGLETVVGPVSKNGLTDTKCVNCGQCVAVCPVGALREKDHTEAVFAAIADPDLYVIAQTAPSVRAAIGEEFGFPLGVDTEGRLAAALKELGFDKVFDTQFGADLTIMEEANEFVERVVNGGTLPMMTSCCPGWIKFCEQDFPELIENLSTCKSPHQMLGASVKSFYAELSGIPKEKIVVVSIMPCTAKKFEINRDDEDGAGVSDVDIAITTRELARMLRQEEIQFEAMPEDEFDRPLGLSTGAAVIFGATGGVMEAALRTAVERLTGESLAEITFQSVRGVDGIKEASFDVAGMRVRAAVVSGLANARKLLESIEAGQAEYDFIEVMACPGGCVNGGGQPVQMADVRAKNDLRRIRAAALYANDEAKQFRKSHENPALMEYYRSYLGEPGSTRAHELLHTSYVNRQAN